MNCKSDDNKDQSERDVELVQLDPKEWRVEGRHDRRSDRRIIGGLNMNGVDENEGRTTTSFSNFWERVGGRI